MKSFLFSLSLIITMMATRCRHLPLSETKEVARYLASLFSCDVESLPTELLIHSYWKLMPHQFSAAMAYVSCLRRYGLILKSQFCQSLKPYYCGRRFGEFADVDRLAVCRKLSSRNGTAANYTVPRSVASMTRRYRTCLAEIRITVATLSYF